MHKPIVFMFSGQGSHYYQMARELFDKQPVFRRWMERLDGIVWDILRMSVLERLYRAEHRKSDPFDKLLYTHPAIFMVEYSLAQLLMETGIVPSYVLGSSLGEFASVAVAGVLDYDSAFRAVIQQAKLLEEYCPPGGMIAVLADSKLYQQEPAFFENCELASVNFDSHFVVSGGREELQRVVEFLRHKELSYQMLQVSRGFHSSWLDAAAPAYLSFIKGLTFHAPRIPLVSSVYGEILTEIPDDYLWQVSRRPVLFPRAVQTLQTARNPTYLDLGPGATLVNFIKYNRALGTGVSLFPIITPFGSDSRNLANVSEMLACRKRESDVLHSTRRIEP